MTCLVSERGGGLLVLFLPDPVCQRVRHHHPRHVLSTPLPCTTPPPPLALTGRYPWGSLLSKGRKYAPFIAHVTVCMCVCSSVLVCMSFRVPQYCMTESRHPYTIIEPCTIVPISTCSMPPAMYGSVVMHIVD